MLITRKKEILSTGDTITGSSECNGEENATTKTKSSLIINWNDSGNELEPEEWHKQLKSREEIEHNKDEFPILLGKL